MAPPAAVQKRVDELRRRSAGTTAFTTRSTAPEIGDAEYDALMRELRGLEAEHPEFVTPDSPTRRVAGQVWDAFATVEHLAPTLSLENAASEADLAEFEARIRRALPGGTFTYVCERVVDSRSYPQGGSAAMSWVP